MKETFEPLYAAELTRELCKDLANAIVEQPDFRNLTAKLHRVLLCNEPANQWTGTDLINKETGELFDGNGRFWSCNQKICSYCVAKQSRRNRRKLRAAIQQPMLVGYNDYFVTFTMPNPGLPILTTRRLMDYAWTLFRKRTWFKDNVIAGCKSEEFTVTKNGIHYHMHTILRSKYIWFSKLRTIWTECVIRAFEAEGIPISIATVDGKLILDCQRIYSREKAIKELCKYITKSDSWAKMPMSSLLDILRIKRFPRMFELFGQWRETLETHSEACADDEDDIKDKKTIVHTENLSDESIEANIETDADLAVYLAKTEDSFRETINYRIKAIRFQNQTAKLYRKNENFYRVNGIIASVVDRGRAFESQKICRVCDGREIVILYSHPINSDPIRRQEPCPQCSAPTPARRENPRDELQSEPKRFVI